MRYSNRLTRLIREHRTAIGLWINLSDASVIELAALAGSDWVMIDTEYNPLTEAHVQSLLYACSSFDVTAVVHVRSNSEDHVKWVLGTRRGVPPLRQRRRPADLSNRTCERSRRARRYL